MGGPRPRVPLAPRDIPGGAAGRKGVQSGAGAGRPPRRHPPVRLAPHGGQPSIRAGRAAVADRGDSGPLRPWLHVEDLHAYMGRAAPRGRRQDGRHAGCSRGTLVVRPGMDMPLCSRRAWTNPTGSAGPLQVAHIPTPRGYDDIVPLRCIFPIQTQTDEGFIMTTIQTHRPTLLYVYH